MQRYEACRRGTMVVITATASAATVTKYLRPASCADVLVRMLSVSVGAVCCGCSHAYVTGSSVPCDAWSVADRRATSRAATNHSQRRECGSAQSCRWLLCCAGFSALPLPSLLTSCRLSTGWLLSGRSASAASELAAGGLHMHACHR